MKLNEKNYIERDVSWMAFNHLDLRADRADVIVPAAQVFIAIARAIGAEAIVVPTIGLADGIINKLASN